MTHFVTSFEEIGRAEGRLEERQALVLRLLNRKIGPLANKLQVRVAVLAPDTLLTLSEALLDFTSQSDLLAWLDQQDHASEA
ncbi:MAG: hypothetical protein OHK0015_06680 [Chloroflexi bacterium OHK40]